MEYHLLGNSGIKVSHICFGSLTLGPLCANLSLEQGRDLLLAAFELGINFVDTAEYYQTYPYLRAALDQTDQQIVVASKTYAATAEDAARAIEDARIALRRNVLDIFLLHEIRDPEDFDQRAEAWQALNAAKANGIIRAIGISTHSAKVAAMAAEQGEIEIIFPLLNMAGIGINDGTVADMLQACAKAKQNGKGVYSMKAIAGGALMHQAKAALTWAFAQKDVDSVAIGFKDRAELITNIGWYHGEEPAEAEQVKLLDRKMAFDKDPSCHGCGRCAGKCSSGALSLTGQQVIWQKDKCIYCGYCIAACPWFCISFC